MAIETVILFKGRDDGLNSEIEKLRQKFADLQARTKESSNVFAGLFKFEMVKQAADKIYELGKSFAVAAMDAEKMRRQLDYLSEGNGQNVFRELRQAALDTPASLASLTDAYRALRVAGINPALNDMRAMATFASTMPGEMADNMKKVSEAMGRVVQGGLISPTELKEQLRSLGVNIPIIDVLRQKLKLTTADMANLGKAGVDAGQMFQATMAWMVENNTQKQDMLSQTVQQVKNAWTEFGLQVADTGIWKRLQGQVVVAINGFRDLKGEMNFRAEAEMISNVFLALGGAVSGVMDGILLAVRAFKIEFKSVQGLWLAFQGAATMAKIESLNRKISGPGNENWTADEKKQMVLEKAGATEILRLQVLAAKEWSSEMDKQLLSSEKKVDELKTKYAGIWSALTSPAKASEEYVGRGLPPSTTMLSAPKKQFSMYDVTKESEDLDRRMNRETKDWEQWLELRRRTILAANLAARKDQQDDYAFRITAANEMHDEMVRQFGEDQAWATARDAEIAKANQDRLDGERQLVLDMKVIDAELLNQRDVFIGRFAQQARDIQATYDKQIQQLTSRRREEVKKGNSVAAIDAEIQNVAAARDYNMKALGEKSGNAYAAGWQRGIDEIKDSMKSGFEEMQQMAHGAASALQSTFSDVFFDAMMGKLKTFKAYVSSFLQGIAREIANIYAQKAAAQIIVAVSTMAAGAFAAGPTATPGSVAAAQKPALTADGGIYGNGWTPIRAYASGGIITGPTLGLVGEGRYNEAVVPLPNGKSIPVQMQGAAAPNVVVNVINQTGTPVSARSSGNPRFDGKAWVIDVIMDGLNRNVGGLRDAVAAV